MRYAIATPHTAATEAGVAALRDGGSAVDAALAAAAMLAVAYPHMCGLGGDLVALLARPDGDVACVNATGAAPAGLRLEDVAARHGGAMPQTGPDTITVPGVLSGWAALAGLGARLPWARLLAPAVAAARDGVPVVPGLAAAYAAHPRIAAALGDPLRQPALAATLEAVAAGGADALYRGHVGAALAAGLQRAGSPLSVDDLAAHEAELPPPLSGRNGDEEVLTSPPNTQGFVLLQLLGATSTADLARRHVEAAAERDAVLGDPRRGGGDTIAVCAMDDDGHAVSLIQSLYFSFGSGVLEPATGIVAHNRGAAFSLDPAAPNALRGGRRPAHTLMPVLTRRDGRITGAHGTMGGRAQPLVHAQLLARLAAGDAPAAAVAAPRFAIEGDVAVAEPGADVEGLRAAGLRVQRAPGLTSACGHAMIVRAGFAAGSDPRADGSATCGATTCG